MEERTPDVGETRSVSLVDRVNYCFHTNQDASGIIKPMKQETYQWDSEDYSKHSAAQFEWAQELIDKLNLQGDEEVLDIGCGEGKVSAAIAARLPRGIVLGIDSSSEMIDQARRAHSHSRYRNLSFIQMDAREIRLRSEYDVVFSNAALHWITDHRPILSGVRQVLRKTGRALFQMGGKGNASEIIAVLNELLSRDEWGKFFVGFPFPYGFFGEEEYRHLLLDAGLVPLRVELLQKDMKQDGREGLISWIRTTWLPYTTLVPEDLRSRFIEEIADAYLSLHPLDNQGRAHVAMVRLEVEAGRD
jgi:trans-aconitate 2-methyltransferase